MINARVDNWQAISWLVERQFPTRFSKSEIQISLNNSFNQTFNALSITVSPEEIREIEAHAEPIRPSVRQMYEHYRPGAPANGNGHANEPLEISAQVVSSPITHKDGDENSPSFWNLFASGASEQLVDKGTAIFAA
jgi:hypothetical protein